MNVFYCVKSAETLQLKGTVPLRGNTDVIAGGGDWRVVGYLLQRQNRKVGVLKLHSLS